MARLPVRGAWLGAVLLAIIPAPVRAQGVGTVTGLVTDQSSTQPIAGAQVYLPGLQLGALSNAQGRFLILNVPSGQREVRAELIGRQTVSQSVNVQAGGTVQVNFVLESRAISLEGVVVTGVAAATPRAQLAFTVDEVEVDPVTVASSINVGSMIQGRMAGAKIIQSNGQPGEAPSIQLRGPKSISGSQEPLIIVDGIISRGSLADIAPNDIERIEVVKGAAAASLYGSRAQAGVIEITTKRGAAVAAGTTEFSLRTTFQKNSIEHVLPLSLSHEYRMTPDGRSFLGLNGQVLTLPADRSAFALDDGGNGRDPWRTFQDKTYPAEIFTGSPYRQILRPGDAYSSFFSVTGNEGRTQYRVSARYQKDEGAMAYQEGATQRNFRVNVDQSIGEKLQFSASAYLADIDQDVIFQFDTQNSLSGGSVAGGSIENAVIGGNGIFRSIDSHTPTAVYDARDADGTLSIIGTLVGRGTNPLYQLATEDWSRGTQRVMGALDATYKPVPSVTLAGNLSYDRSDRTETAIRPAGYKRIDQPPLLGSMYIEERLQRDVNASVTASIARNFGELTTRTRLRYLVENQLNSQLTAGNQNFATLGVPRLGLLTGTAALDSNEQKVISQGIFAIAALTYRERYIMDVLARRDGSSLFGVEERWQNYYRLATAWRMSEESWWPFPLITEFKPRYSIGTAGGRPGFSYQYQTYSVDKGRIIPRVLGNDRLKPETSTEQEFGLDAVVADRLSVQANYVRSTVDDQLLRVPSSAVMGFESQWQNAGTVQATTYEAVFEMAFVERPDLLWTGRLNLDRTTQQITRLSVPPYEIRDYRARIIVKEGEELGTFYGVKWSNYCAVYLPKGTDCSLFQINDDGLLVYVGRGNDYRDGRAKRLWGTVGTTNGVTYDWGMPIRSIVGNEFTRIGNSQPDLNASFAQDVKWRDFGFTLLFDAEFGADIYNQSRQGFGSSASPGNDQRNKPDELKKPIPYYGPAKLYAGNIRGDWWVEKSDYIKLRELSVNYTLDDALPDFLGLTRATINLTGRNLRTFTGYVGNDPEVGKASFGGSAAIGRIDEYFYPNYRSFGLDVELVF
jgi:TonB-linked SusC/RagA family outer membrane protein